MYDEGYYRHRESTRDFLIEAKLLYDMLHPQTDSRILEVGCGGGALLAFLESKGHSPTGVDTLEEAIGAAGKTARKSRILMADAGDLPFPDGSFDRLISQHLVEHLEDLHGALKEWGRVLKTGGVLAICTPNRLYPCPSLFHDPGHAHIYDPMELREVVQEAGYRVENCRTVFPHLYRGKVSVKVGVPLYRLFAPLPPFKNTGRSLLLSACKN